MKLFAFIIIIVLVDFFCSSEAWWVCHSPSTNHGGWYNRWDQPFTFTCPTGQAMTEMHSIYSPCNHDRVFKFACRTNKAVSKTCHNWSHYVNDFDKLVSFKCPDGGFLAGISSYHSNTREDRRFKFRCCHRHHYHPHHCTRGSHFVNQLRQPINFSTPPGYFLVGVTSLHDNHQEDRRWNFEYCQVERSHSQGYQRKRKAKKY